MHRNDPGLDQDFAAARAAFNRGDHAAVERFLADIAPQPEAEVRRLELRINTAIMRAPQKVGMPMRRFNRRTARTRRRRPVVRTRARSPGRRSADDPHLAPHRLGGRL